MAVRTRKTTWKRRSRPWARTAVGLAKFAYNSYQKFKKPYTAATGITNQHDYSFQYKKKYMPRRKKRQWIKFSKKVIAVNNKGLATQTRVFNNQITGYAGSGQQSHLFMSLYGKAGTSLASQETGLADLSMIFDAYGPANTQEETINLNFKSAVLDLTARNPMSVGLEVDLYVLNFNRDGRDLNSMAAAMTLAENETQNISGSSPLVMSQRGVTLFDMPQLISLLGIKIVKKVKYFMTPGGTFTYQLRDPKDRKIHRLNISSGTTARTEFVEPKVTQGILLIFKTLPGVVDDNTQLTCGVTRKYAYAEQSNIYARHGYN